MARLKTALRLLIQLAVPGTKHSAILNSRRMQENTSRVAIIVSVCISICTTVPAFALSSCPELPLRDKAKIQNCDVIGPGVVAYPLVLEPRDQIRGLFVFNGSPSVLVYNLEKRSFKIEDFLRGGVHPFKGDIPAGPPVLGQQYAEPQVFHLPSSDVTLQTSSQIPDDLMEYYYNDCLPPTQSRITIERGGETYTKVLLYRFLQPQPLVPRMQCEQDLFATPNTFATVIDPELIGLLYNSTLFLVGESYTSMPVVVALQENFDLSAKSSTVGLFDDYEVDRIVGNVFLQFKSTSSRAAKNDTPAVLTAEINSALESLFRRHP